MIVKFFCDEDGVERIFAEDYSYNFLKGTDKTNFGISDMGAFFIASFFEPMTKKETTNLQKPEITMHFFKYYNEIVILYRIGDMQYFDCFYNEAKSLFPIFKDDYLDNCIIRIFDGHSDTKILYEAKFKMPSEMQKEFKRLIAEQKEKNHPDNFVAKHKSTINSNMIIAKYKTSQLVEMAQFSFKAPLTITHPAKM